MKLKSKCALGVFNYRKYPMNYYCYDPIIRDIPDFPNYQISEDGVVYNKITGKESRQYRRNGYLQCELRKDNKRYTVKIHRILATIFIKNPNLFPCVDHIDRNISNNSLKNLRWVTLSMNSRNNSLRSSNTSSVKGVSIKNDRNYIYWYAHITNDEQKQISKSFPHTPEGFELAKAWRKEKELKYGYL